MKAEFDVDVLVAGGGVGGCAAALAATDLGLRVLLVEESEWPGGQLTSQMVPPDEHPWIEQQGCTRRYRAYREGVRRYYRQHYPLSAAARADLYLNPGAGSVSQLCHEPRVGVAVLEQLMAWPQTRGLLEIRLRHAVRQVAVRGDCVEAVFLLDLCSGAEREIRARYVIDATESGDLLPLARTEYVAGAESQSETGELHAPSGPARPDHVQALTWCLAVARDPRPGADYTIDKPPDYEFWRDFQPRMRPPWPGRLFDVVDIDPITLQPRTAPFFEDPDAPQAGQFSGWWKYRRVVYGAHFQCDPVPHEVTIINWPLNDYLLGNIIDQPPAAAQRHLEAARQQTLSLLYWLQTGRPRPDGGCGYPGLYPRPDISGTADGLAKMPYVRESRRIRARFTVKEQHIGAAMRGVPDSPLLTAESLSPPLAERFDDTVGVGYYRIDLHPDTGGNNYIDVAALPFQIPLGALIPQRMRNLLPGAKNIGTTHITNGCYRLHPVEWNIGEAAGLLAGFCIKRDLLPAQVHERQDLLREYQGLLLDQGFQLAWRMA